MFRSSPSERKLRRRKNDRRPAQAGRAFVENLESRRLLASVVNLTLVDAAGDRDIMPLTNGQTINLQQLPSRQLNVRADVDGSTASVRFGLDGNSNYRIESGAPLALAGDNGGDYHAMTFATGSHTLAATPFSGKSATGAAGAARTVTFNVIDQAEPTPEPEPEPTAPQVSSLVLVNADTDQDIMILRDGQTLDLAALGTRNLNVRAVTGNAQSVRFGLDANANYRTESGMPFTLAGDSGGDYNAWTPSTGSHTLTVTPYAAKSASGAAGAAATVRFTVTSGDTDPAPTPTAPAAPSGLAASAASASQIDLTWADASNNETGFKIERSTNGTSFTQVATVAASAKSYSATGLNASTQYTFRVRATNTVGDSAYSNVANATTSAAPANPNPTLPGEWPDASSTGPNNRSILRVQSGGITTTRDGQVIENVHLKGGSITVNHNNVTIRNFIIENPSTTGAAIKFQSNDLVGGKIQYGEIFGGNATNGVSGSGYHAYRLHIHNMQADAFRVKKDVTIEESYLHDFSQHPDAHGDGVQMYPTDGGNMRILNNRIDARGGNAALFQVDNGWHIEGNWFSGGNYTIQATGESANKFINNTFDGSGPRGTSKYGPIRIGAGDRDAMGAWTGNKWEDSGAAINLKQSQPDQFVKVR